MQFRERDGKQNCAQKGGCKKQGLQYSQTGLDK